MVITPKAVEEKLRMSNCNNSQGPHGITARVLKEMSKELALTLNVLFNKLLN